MKSDRTNFRAKLENIKIYIYNSWNSFRLIFQQKDLIENTIIFSPSYVLISINILNGIDPNPYNFFPR